MSDYQAAKEVEENERNPKNRFMGLFYHASQVGDSWGWNWPFWLGVVVFSILVGFMSVFDIIYLLQVKVYGWFLFWFIIRMVSDGIALVGIVFATLSIIQTSFGKATIAYYALFISFILNTCFCIYCIVKIFDKTFWTSTTYRIVVWLLNEFVLVLFCWVLFCNMVDIGRKVRNAGATNFV